MKRAKITSCVIGAIFLFVGIGMGLSSQKGLPIGKAPFSSATLYPSKEEPLGQSAAAGAAVSTEILKNAQAAQDGIAGNSFLPTAVNLVKVTRVIDGDTINVEIDNKIESVRYIGIDTPETVDPRKPVQCFGVEASKKNKELVEGEVVRLEKDITDRDKYNRLLRYVWLGDTLINKELVTQGFAKSYSYPPDIKYQDQFIAEEKKARENKAGLWGACESVVTNVAPAPRVASPTAGDSIENPSCTIKGNVSASGEKIYHMQGCGSYSKTTIDEARGEKWFCSESEAKAAGWRKALNCI